MRALLLAFLVASEAAGGIAQASEPSPNDPLSPLSIDEAVRIALANHPSVGAARAQRSAAAARTRQAWAPLLPGITGSFAYQPQTANFAASPSFARALGGGGGSSVAVGIDRMCDPSDGACAAQAHPCVVVPGQSGCYPVARAVSASSATLYNFFQAQVGLYLPLFDFGRTIYGGLSARESETTFERAEEATELTIKLNVRVAFYNALAAEELVAVASESVATQRRHLEQMKGFVEVGTRTRVDLAQARSDEASAELQLAQARGQREAAMAMLHEALGLESWNELHLLPPPPDSERLAPPPEALQTLVDEAVATRPEPRQLAAQARAADLQRKSIRGAWFPSLTLSLGPSFAGTQLDSLTPNFSLALSLAYPLLGMNPYLLWNQGREAEANVQVALEQGRVTRNSIRLETAQALATLRSAREAVTAAEALVQAATERRELQTGRFEAGLGTVLELQDAEFAYVNARGQLVQAAFTLRVAGARLDKALGR